MRHKDRVCARCGSSGGTLLDIDTGSVCHAEPYQCIHWLRVDNIALRGEMELRQQLYDAHPGPREEEFAALRADKERLERAISMIANGDWIVASWYNDTARDFVWRVNVRGATVQGRTHYDGTEWTGATPVAAALTGIAAIDHARGAA